MRRFTGNPVCGTTLIQQYLVVTGVLAPLYLVGSDAASLCLAVNITDIVILVISPLQGVDPEDG
jgi:hypothetical protein